MKPTNKLMKRLSLYLFLILFSFQAPSWADDIRDFEIEGMSLGNSALDYFNENEIKKNIRKNQYPGSDGKFFDAGFSNYPFFTTYDSLQIVFKKNDKKYIIYSLSGIIYFDDKIDNCLEKQKEIFEELSNLFKNPEIKKPEKIKHPADKLGNTWVHPIYFIFKSFDEVELTCIDSSRESKKEDYLMLGIDSKELVKWLEEYYS